ncbi:hypothetical protein BKA62DRAFT_718619, partial [Auriculariales sp. MPI-PUGE-AT-0066]
QAVPSLALQVHGLSMVVDEPSECGMLRHILHAAVRIRSIHLSTGWKLYLFDTAVQMLSEKSFWTGWMELKSLHLRHSVWSQPYLEQLVLPEHVTQGSTAHEEDAAMPALHTLVASITWLEQNAQHATWPGLRTLRIIDSRDRDSRLLLHRRLHEVVLRASASDSFVHLTSLTMTGYANTDAHIVGIFQCLTRLRDLRMWYPTRESFETTMAATPKGLRTLSLGASIDGSPSSATAFTTSLEAVFKLGALGCLLRLTTNFSRAANSELRVPLAELCQRRKIRLCVW